MISPHSILNVGLTGGIASGKSTVSRMLSADGIPVICFDELAQQAVDVGSPALEEIGRVFGHGFINPDGKLNRDAMAAAVFSDPSKRAQLESIVHPVVYALKAERTADIARQGHLVVVDDVPLLYEVNYERFCDCVIVVYVPRSVQEMRLIERNGISRKDAQARLDAQMDIEEKRIRCDYVIDNSGSVDDTRRQVKRITEKLKSRAKPKQEIAVDQDRR